MSVTCLTSRIVRTASGHSSVARGSRDGGLLIQSLLRLAGGNTNGQAVRLSVKKSAHRLAAVVNAMPARLQLYKRKCLFGLL